MAQSMRENVSRAHARTAGIAAGVVAAGMIVQSVLQAVISVFGNLTYSVANGEGIFRSQFPFEPIAALFVSFGTSVLPIAAGVFLAFWAVVPLTAQLRIGRVVLRSLVASAIASVVSLVISAVYSVGSSVATGPFFANSFPRPDGVSLFYSLFGAVQSVLYTFVSVTPLVMLAGVLVWLWAAKSRPAASGA